MGTIIWVKFLKSSDKIPLNYLGYNNSVRPNTKLVTYMQ